MLTEIYKERNIERVLNEALKLSKEIGISAVNNTNLAKRAKLSQKSIQRYFDGKTDMIYKVSQKLIKRNTREIKEALEDAHYKKLTGLQQIECLLKIHNDYQLIRFKDVVFLQDADTYCRYRGEQPEKFWKSFRTSELLEQALFKSMKKGAEDGSVAEKNVTQETAKSTSILCMGLVERLATDLDCRVMELDQTLQISDGWIKRLLEYLEGV